MADGATDPRVIEQTLRKGEVEIRKLSADATAAEIAATVPKLPAEIPAGKLDAGDNSSPFGVVAAYRALGPIAHAIAERVPTGATGVWIVPSDVVSRHRAVDEAIRATLDRIKCELDDARKLLSPEETQMAMVAPALISLAASAIPAIASLMRTNTTIRSQAVTMTFSALASEVAAELRTRLGNAAVLSVYGAPAPLADDLITTVRTAERARDDLALDLVAYRANGVSEPPADVAATAERLAAVKLFAAERAKGTDQAEFEKALTLVEKEARAASDAREGFARRVGVSAYVDKVLTDVTAALAAMLSPDAQGVTPLQMAGVYEANRKAHVLILESSYTGAESVYEELVGRADKGAHFGSTVVTYFLLDCDSRLLDSGVVYDVVIANTKVGHREVEWSDGASTPQ
jgi:hypothetical protein